MRNGDAVPDEKQITYLATESAWLAKHFAAGMRSARARIPQNVPQKSCGSRWKCENAIHSDQWLKLVTENAATALGLSAQIGRLASGLKADIVVHRRRDADANESLLKNTIQEVQLVVVGGAPLYGNRAAMAKLRSANCENLVIHGSQKRICVRHAEAGVENAEKASRKFDRFSSPAIVNWLRWILSASR